MMLENLYGWVNMSHLGVIQYVCNMAAYSDTKALTRRYPNNSFLSWLLSSLSLGGCFLRNLNIADLLYILIYHFLSCKTKQHTDDATPHKGPKIDTRLSQYVYKFRYAITIYMVMRNKNTLPFKSFINNSRKH